MSAHRRHLLLAGVAAVLLGACGGSDDSVEPAAGSPVVAVSESAGDQAGNDRSSDTSADSITPEACAAWAVMLRAQPEGRFDDASEMADQWAAYADAVEAAAAEFPGDVADLLTDVADAARDFGEDPSSPEANDRMALLFESMFDASARVLLVCGDGVAEL